jgi:hypothetical protein
LRAMNDTTKYIVDVIKIAVWSGFYSPPEVQQLIDDILEEGADEAMLRAAVDPEFENKAVSEKSWPAVTDCDRLDRAFEQLDAGGIIALQNAGMTMSDGISDVGEVLHERGRKGVKGYCFYHEQDVQRAVAGGGLMIAFGDLDDDKVQTEVGRVVKGVLEAAGFEVAWNGDPERRISLPRIDWKRRRIK